METKPSGGALLSFDDPIYILKNAEDVGPFDLFQRIGNGQWGSLVSLKHRIVDLKHWPLREDRSPFDDIFQLSNIAGPGILHQTVHGRLRHSVDFLAHLA